MSIFKSSFKPYVRTQIESRQNLVNSQGTRPLDVQKYVSSKSPWVKMTSFVDYADPKKGGKPTKDLAKQYVLMGGTLYPDPKDTTDTIFKLRSGILAKDSAYGTDLGSGKKGFANMQYGIRPMPGITSVNVKSKSAYGSLREAVVKFYAWDVKQLEDLLILFMRPGYPVLLEWGWSMYIDNKDGKVRSFDSPTINCFQDGLTQDAVYAALEKYREQFFGNYDGMLGLIRNYETSMLVNGGFECTVTLISIGDVIDSLKMNCEPTDNTTLLASINQEDFKDAFEYLLYEMMNNKDTPGNYYGVTKLAEAKESGNKITGVDTNVYKAAEFISGTSKAESNSDVALSQHFIQFAFLVHILNTQKNLYDINDKRILDIELPLYGINGNKGDGLCLASYNSVTIDSNVCVIKNTKAKFLTSGNASTASFDGFNPFAVNVSIVDSTDVAATTAKEYLNGNSSLGVIGNIYVNLGMIIQIYRAEHRKNNGQVYLGQFIKSILHELEFTLGSINNFDIFTEDNKLVIIDKHYVEDETGSDSNTKFRMNILGTDTIVRNQKIISKIFPSQATIIAIAAQNRENVASLQSSTYTHMNRGLQSRIFSQLNENLGALKDDAVNEQILFFNNLTVLIYFVNTYILTWKTDYSQKININSINTFLNNFLVKVSKSTNYRAIIPVSLEVALDGVGGVTIGEIFTINKDILPREYNDNSVGFIVTGISQDITRPDWQTTLHTQFCLLDQKKLQDEVREFTKKLMSNYDNYLKESVNELRVSIRYYNILAGYFADIFTNHFEISYYNNPNPRNAYDFLKLTYRDGVLDKQLKARIEDNKLQLSDGSTLTLEKFLDDVAQQYAFVLRNETSQRILNEVNNKSDLVFTDIDNKVLVGLSYYIDMDPEVKKDFVNTLNEDVLKNKDSKYILFKLLLESSSITSGVYTPVFLKKAIEIKNTVVVLSNPG